MVSSGLRLPEPKRTRLELPLDEPQVLREGREIRSRARQFGQRVPYVSMGAASSFCDDTEDGEVVLVQLSPKYLGTGSCRTDADATGNSAYPRRAALRRRRSCPRGSSPARAPSLRAFRGHVDRFLATKEGSRLRDWNRELALFSPRFPAEQRAALEADGWICRDLVDFRRMLLPEDRGANGLLRASAKVEEAE